MRLRRPKDASTRHVLDRQGHGEDSANGPDSQVVEDVLTSANGLLDPRGFDIDPVAGKMYWADSAGGRIQSANLDGSQITDVLVDLSSPSDIQLDVAAGKIYWGDRNSHKIQRANLDGTGIEDLFDVSNGLDRPHGILLDTTANQIYWTDTNTAAIHAVISTEAARLKR